MEVYPAPFILTYLIVMFIMYAILVYIDDHRYLETMPEAIMTIYGISGILVMLSYLYGTFLGISMTGLFFIIVILHFTQLWRN